MRNNKNFLRYTTAFLCGLIACLPATAGTLTYPEGTTLIFNPSSTIAGVNVGSIAGDPSAPLNGDLWYDSTANELTARINGANVALGSGGSGSGTAAGLVYITNDSGTTTNYNPSADTDSARGTALLAAVAAATSGQTVKVGAGTFALAANRLLIPDDVDLDLDPGTLITGTANLSTVGPIVRPGNRTTVRGGKIQGTAASGVSQAPFGISSFVASPDPQTEDFVLDGVTLEADSDAFYILSNEPCTGTIRNCTFISKYDIIYVSGYNGDPARHSVQIYNTQGIVVGLSSIASPMGRGTTIAYGATVDIHGGSLAVSDGGTTLNAGAASYEGGTLNLYSVKITTSNGANHNYDLYTNGSGVIRVNGGAGSGTGGIFSTNSGANVTYTGNLSTGGNGTADNGKLAVFGTGGILDATAEIAVHNASTAAHAYIADDATIGFHAAGETNPRELAFPSDVLEGEAKEIATKNWVNAQGFGSGGRNPMAALSSVLSGSTWTLATATDYYGATSAARTIALPASPVDGEEITIAKLTVTSGPVLITMPAGIYRTGTSSTTPSISLPTGNHKLAFKYTDATWTLTDSGVDEEAAYTVFANSTGSAAAPVFTATPVVTNLTVNSLLTLPQSDDPDVSAAGNISWDTDGWLRAYDGTNQVAVARKIETIQATVITPQDLADAQRDAFLVWSNESGMDFVVTGWKGWAGTDDTTLNIEEVDADGVSNNTTVDAVELATGTGPFTGSDTTITGATIENGHLLVLDFDDTDAPTYVKITIYGFYNANVN